MAKIISKPVSTRDDLRAISPISRGLVLSGNADMANILLTGLMMLGGYRVLSMYKCIFRIILFMSREVLENSYFAHQAIP